MTYQCDKCKQYVRGNDGKLLIMLPEYIRNAYPVEPKFASDTTNFHIDRDWTDIIEELMLTYGNGDLISKMMYARRNRDYTRKLSEYLADWAGYQAVSNDADRLTTPPYPLFNNEWITHYPPAGDGIRDLFEDACHSRCTPYGVSDHDRCVREIQSVGTNSMFAQDHTMEVTKNYRRSMGAFAVWDVATETGEIASAVVVGTTNAIGFAHAAESLTRRSNFKPRVM